MTPDLTALRERVRAIVSDAIYRGYSGLPESDDLSQRLDALLNDVEAALAPPTEGVTGQRLRRMLFLAHKNVCGMAALYGDDGEMSCGSCFTDFKRDSLDVIDEKNLIRAHKKLFAPPPAGTTAQDTEREALFARINAELDRAYAKHGRVPWSRHEFYAVLLEEVDELWDDVKADASREHMDKEIVQVAAMCFRYWETRTSDASHGDAARAAGTERP